MRSVGRRLVACSAALYGRRVVSLVMHPVSWRHKTDGWKLRGATLGGVNHQSPILTRRMATVEDPTRGGVEERCAEDELPPRYDFRLFEESLYEWWEAEGYFAPRASCKESPEDESPYTLPMPPPNVTGRLHLGHAMFVALQDILARFHRMRGRPTLWLPGTDHAGIATQLLVEKAVEAEGSSRLEMGREKFLERVWAWKEENGGAITQQMRRLGASADWSRERFTLEPAMNAAVREAFVRLHEKGLVYRGERMVNWSPNLRTAVSDLEVDTVDRVGKLYYFKYPVDDDDDADAHLPVATTRPETILGDTAVCVHPNDARYKKFVGKFCKVPGTDRRIPVIADEYVDPEFGTGALKITPGHDPNDYAIGKKFDLPIVSIMTEAGAIAEGFGKYSGLDRFECRRVLWADLEEQGLAFKIEEREQRVPVSQRGGEVVEPMVSTQWFIKADGMAAKGVEAVRDGRIKILPPRFEKEWYHWLENIQDWCVSRQTWWGHRIPAWYAVNQDTGEEDIFVARDEDEARRLAVAKGYADTVVLRQEDDVLDTWFSSGLWPFATVGWPDVDQPDYRRFFPANCLETGYDILFFWVARMVMLSLELTEDIPFDTVYMHGLVRDGKGEKMSKTKGNVVDPLQVVDTYGADALRYTLVTGVTPGQDVPLSMERVEQNRNFANKLWNVGRFVNFRCDQLSDDFKGKLRDIPLSGTAPIEEDDFAQLALPERWIVSRAHHVAETVAQLLEDYAVGEAGKRVYEFLRDELADWYVELAKTRDLKTDQGLVSCRVLIYAYDVALKTIHPFMPHVTDYLWCKVCKSKSNTKTDSIMIADWPAPRKKTLHVDHAAVDDFDAYRDLVRALRNLRAEYDAKKPMALTLLVAKPSLAHALTQEVQGLALLAKADPDRFQVLPFDDDANNLVSDPDSARVVVADGLEALVPYADLKTVKDVAKELQRLDKQLAKLDKEINGLQARLNTPGFVDKAPPAVVDDAKATLADKIEQRASVQDTINDLDP